MLHTQIQNDEVVERYVRNRLTPEDRQAFEEHFFACDECFEKVQAMERFAAGIRDAAERGLLEDGAVAADLRQAPAWTRWALAGSSAAAIALAAVIAWALLVRIPSLQRNLRVAVTQMQSQQQTLAQLQTSAAAGPAVQANVPLVMLQETRGEPSTTAALPSDARQLIVWVEPGPTRFQTYRIEIYSSASKLVTSVDGLSRGPYGALAASIPTESLQPGVYQVRLVGQTPPPASLVSEYRLRILRP